MALYRTEAIILRGRKYLEADSLLTVLTKQKGKVSVIAKGVRKPNSRLRGGVQVFTYNDMLLHQGRNLDIVTQSQCLEAFIELQEDIKSMTAACYWGELLDAFTQEGESDPELFNLALAGFHLLCLSPTILSVKALEVKLLSVLGYRPCLGSCVACGQPLTAQVSFSVRLGGALCQSCTLVQGSSCDFSHEALNIWQQLLKMDLSKISRLKVSLRGLSLLEKVVDEFILTQLDFPLKSRNLLKEMIQE